MPYKDPAVGRAKAAARYQANRDEALAKRAAFHEANPEQARMIHMPFSVEREVAL